MSGRAPAGVSRYLNLTLLMGPGPPPGIPGVTDGEKSNELCDGPVNEQLIGRLLSVNQAPRLQPNTGGGMY